MDILSAVSRQDVQPEIDAHPLLVRVNTGTRMLAAPFVEQTFFRAMTAAELLWDRFELKRTTNTDVCVSAEEVLLLRGTYGRPQTYERVSSVQMTCGTSTNRGKDPPSR